MQPPVRVLPRVVLLGEHAVPGRAKAYVTVRLPANGWTIDRIEADDPDTAVARTEVEVDGGIRYRITQTIARAGDYVSTVRFVVRQPDGQTESATIHVHYHG